MTEYQPYGVRHFLRRLDPEGARSGAARPVSLRTGGMLDKAQYADLDAFDLGGAARLPDAGAAHARRLRAGRPPRTCRSGAAASTRSGSGGRPPRSAGASAARKRRSTRRGCRIAREVLRLGALAAAQRRCAARGLTPSAAAARSGRGGKLDRLAAGGRRRVGAAGRVGRAAGTVQRGDGRAALVLARRLLPRPRAAARRRPPGRVGATPAGGATAQLTPFGSAAAAGQARTWPNSATRGRAGARAAAARRSCSGRSRSACLRRASRTCGLPADGVLAVRAAARLGRGGRARSVTVLALEPRVPLRSQRLGRDHDDLSRIERRGACYRSACTRRVKVI